jgi:hypothetical protein
MPQLLRTWTQERVTQNYAQMKRIRIAK